MCSPRWARSTPASGSCCCGTGWARTGAMPWPTGLGPKTPGSPLSGSPPTRRNSTRWRACGPPSRPSSWPTSPATRSPRSPRPPRSLMPPSRGSGGSVTASSWSGRFWPTPALRSTMRCHTTYEKLNSSDPTDPWQDHRAILDAEGAGQPEPIRTAAPLLEPREPDPPASLLATPKVRKGAVQIPQGFLGGALGDLIQPGVAGGALEPVEQPVQFHRSQGLVAALEGFPAHRQAP